MISRISHLSHISHVSHTKNFGIYHWDTFDNQTLLVDEANNLQEAINRVKNKYGERISEWGADRIDIVDCYGNIVKKFKVG